jgi:probable HAF family extracellular repeat protein
MKSWTLNRKSLLGLLPVFLGISLFGCGSGRPAPVIMVAVSAADLRDAVAVASRAPFVLQAGKTGQFLANALGDTQNAGVTWIVSCAVSSCGSISPTSTASGEPTTYMAPANLPKNNLTVTLTATSITQPSAQGSITITVPSVAVTVAPSVVTVPSGGATQFTATVNGDSSNAGVHWALVHCEAAGFSELCMQAAPPSCDCGTISSTSSASGVPITYTGPTSPPVNGALILVATSVANGDARFVVPITVSASSASAAIRPAASEPDAGETLETRDAAKQVHYRLINLGTLGGSASNGFGGPNNRGWVTGDANLAGDQNEHAALWRDGVITDLGTLGGPNSSVPMPVKDDRGLVVGVAQIAEVDPLDELWGNTFACTSVICQGSQNLLRGFRWEDGVMTALPTLGGNNSGALGVNNRGQIVGAAETSNQDPGCAPPQMLDFKAVVWGPNRGQIEVLPVFPGDTVATALAINDHGQVVGTSGPCQGPPSGLALRHAVLWQHATVTDLGSLGGMMVNAANAINNRGQVVGQSDLSGDTFTHAFFWQHGVMTDLGTLPGDSISMASDINDKGQVVGTSCDATFSVCRAFLWEDGVMTDLNTLISPNSPLFLAFGAGINDRGEITGSACVISGGACTSEVPAFLAIPCGLGDRNNEECQDVAEGLSGVAVRSAPVLPQVIRERLRLHRGFGSFGNRPDGP